MRTDECGQTHTDIDRITPMITPTWQDRERRILEHIVQAWEDGRQAEVDEIAQALDLSSGPCTEPATLPACSPASRTLISCA